MSRSRIILIVLAACCAGTVTAACLRSLSGGGTTNAAGPSVSALAAALEPPVDVGPQRLKAAGVGREPAPGIRQIHQHVAVRIFYRGAELTPPRNLGIVDAGRLAALHTHDRSGVVHMHRPSGRPAYRLTQLLAVWGLRLADGHLRAGRLLLPAQTWVDGRPIETDPQLNDHADVIVEVAAQAGDLSSRAPLGPFAWSQVPLRTADRSAASPARR